MVSPNVRIYKKRRKFVRFAADDSICQWQDGPLELTIENICDIWYQSEDSDEFRDSAREDALDAMDSKMLCTYMHKTYGNTDDKTQEKLNKWAKYRDSKRGLERFVDEEYAANRLQVRRKTMQAVLYTQERLYFDGGEDYQETHGRKLQQQSRYDRSAEVIRNVSTILTRDAKRFAAMMGRADETAVSSCKRRMASTSRVRSSSKSQGEHQTRPPRPAIKAGRSPPLQPAQSVGASEDSDSCCSTLPVDPNAHAPTTHDTDNGDSFERSPQVVIVNQ